MKTKPVNIGNTAMRAECKTVNGTYVSIGDELYYKISNYADMAPFFMSIVSDSDHWMYIWSNGALTAGRKNADIAIFPYYTDDKILDSAEITGSKTIVLVEEKDKQILWEPFSERYQGVYSIERNCYKNIYGNKLIFEEVNIDLQLTFQYSWLNSKRFGFIKRSAIHSNREQMVNLNLLDGIQNILPYGVTQSFQNDYSTLVDAYKKNELEPDTNLGIYTLSSIPVDRAEPSEALKASVVWSLGIESKSILISSRQLDAFRKGLNVEQETAARAGRGAYFVNSRIELTHDEILSWYFVADTGKDVADVVALKKKLTVGTRLISEIENDIASGTNELVKIVAQADGLQKTADKLSTTRHFSNVLFNVMRGGIFDNQGQIDTNDFNNFVFTSNTRIYKEYKEFLTNLPRNIGYKFLNENIEQQNDAGLIKLFYEYLPLTFSRRHGDPSRPWNKFSIDIQDEHGEKVLNYQGNWRDIFQNWEALAFSYPEYLINMITRFVNSSTADGYNPYRLTRNGADWEVLDPEDPWSYIGYWGDHQVIYLLKLLELLQKTYPDKPKDFLKKEIFSYTNVPYRIKQYSDILFDPINTVNFEQNIDEQINVLVEQTGTDGKLLLNEQGTVFLVNLTEKLLVPILAKLSNFIPEAGIWMNTQRPEWNDANNALVGNGVSMVTLYYLRRHLSFCQELFQSMHDDVVFLSTEVDDFFVSISSVFNKNRHLLKHSFTDRDRKVIMDLLGTAGSEYRSKIYNDGFTQGKSVRSFKNLDQFCETALEWVDHSIHANRREDNLYHAYNLIAMGSNESASIRYLNEMLEGQVAVLSSGLLQPGEALEVLKVLRNSGLYRQDQFSYTLYPNRKLPDFADKNNIPPSAIEGSEVLQILVKMNNRDIIIQDINGGFHFNGNFRNSTMLIDALRKLNLEEIQPLVEKELDNILKIYEDIFDHMSFTGRSGTFFKYEGLGSIYWHMVSKLLLAVQDNYYHALDWKADSHVLEGLKSAYFEIQNGIGLKKSPEHYGAFPTDPYSHTPAHAGVQQPGMTGQVKEDILSRFGELGIEVRNGVIGFNPVLLRKEEFLKEPAIFTYFNVEAKEQSIKLQLNSLAFTFVQVPVVYHIGDEEQIVITTVENKKQSFTGLYLDLKISASIFNRNGEVRQIDVFLNPNIH